jgi:energy-converting hydrogenase Eha subunit G
VQRFVQPLVAVVVLAGLAVSVAELVLRVDSVAERHFRILQQTQLPTSHVSIPTA